MCPRGLWLVDLTNFHWTFLLLLRSIFNVKPCSNLILTLLCSCAQVARPTVLVLSFHGLINDIKLDDPKLRECASGICCSFSCGLGSERFGEGEVWGGVLFGEVCRLGRFAKRSVSLLALSLVLAGCKNWNFYGHDLSTEPPQVPGFKSKAWRVSCLRIKPPQVVCLASSVKTLSVLTEYRTTAGGLPGFKSKDL